MFKKIRASIKVELTIITVLIMAIPLIAVVVISNLSSVNRDTKLVVQYNNAKAEAIEADVVSVLEKNMHALIGFANAPSTIEYVEAKNNGDSVSANLEAGIMAQMVSIDDAQMDGNCTIVSGNKGMQLLRTEGELLDISDREYYLQAMAGQFYVSDTQVSKSTGSRIVTFAAPVYNADHTEVIGIAQRNYNLSVFHDLLVSELFEDKMQLIIIDRAGTIMAHSDHEIDPGAEESAADSKFYADAQSGAASGTYSAKQAGDTWQISWVKEPYTGWVIVSRRSESVALHDVTVSLFIMLGIGVVFLIVGIVVSLFYAGRIANPIKSVSESVDGLTRGNLMSKFDESSAKREDEVGHIARNSIALAEKLQDVIGHTKEMASDLKKAGQELSGTSDQASEAAGQVSGAVEDVSKGAISQAESVQDAANEMQIIGDGVESISESTEELSDASKNMEKECGKTMEALKTLITQSDKVSESVGTIADTIQRTNDNANEIGEFTEAINSIATQTNLLSLNASIEAARAGEAGKGFAVVADEISHLAAQSKESADKIKDITDKLRQDAAASVEVMSMLSENVTEQGNQLNATRERMNSMSEGIAAVATSAENISGRVGDLRSAKDSLGSIIDDLSAISQQNAASTQETNASMEELNATFNIISESAGSLRTSAEELNDMIGFFRLDDVETGDDPT